MIEKFPCPVCGKRMVEEFEICDECGWENTGIINIDGGLNEMTLEEAREAYKNGEKVR